MDVPTVMAIIGGIALLLGIFGGGVKAKEIEFPRLDSRNRIISLITGIVLLAIAALLSSSEKSALSPSNNPTANPYTQTFLTSSPTTSLENTPTQTVLPSPPATLTENPPTQTASPVTTQVDATQDWQDTGVMVQVGETFIITYLSGLWTFDRNIPFTDGTGTPGFSNDQAPVLNANLGALVAKIGDGPPFFVGDQISVSSDRAGTLFLRINDTKDVGDNEGSISVEVRELP